VVPSSGAPPVARQVTFASSVGAPSLNIPSGVSVVLVGWFSEFSPLLAGTMQVGTLRVPIPASAKSGDTYAVQVINPSGTTDGVTDLPMSGTNGTVTVGGQVAVLGGSDLTARAARTNAAVLPGAATLCAGGERDGSPCATDADCPQGACALALGVCDGGSDDGLLCDCPAGTCSAGPSCSAAPVLGTCSGGPAAAQCCETSFNCAGHRPCVATQRVCAGGLAKGMPCLSASQCPDGACAVSGKLCAGGDFDRVACVDRADCPRGACLAPGESVPPTATATATPTPQALAPSATGPVDRATSGDGCSIGAHLDSDTGTGWSWLAGGLVVIWMRRYRT
jgi:hypothetical protein